MKLYTTLFFLVALSIIGNAQDPTPPSELLNADLRSWLKNNWFNPWEDINSYTESREEMYSYIDNEGGQVYCVYTGFHQDSEFTSYLDPINCEHSVPQSYFGSAEPMRSDIHHLFPTHGLVNSSRGNLPFMEINDSQTDTWWVGDEGDIFDYSSIPSVSIDSYSELLTNEGFEPRESHKGNVARAIFYFYTMYPTQAGSLNVLANQDMLYDWHLEDPVDSQEAIRDQKIQEVQGNYNPYVRMPELVEKAWGYFVVGIEEKPEITLEVFPNPATDKIRIHIPEANDISCKATITTMQGQRIFEETIENQEIDLRSFDTGIYILEVVWNNQVFRQSFIKEN